jgi:glutathione S-transferase
MKLYYSPGACSLSPHIVLTEAGLPYSAEKVDLKTKKTEKGADFLAINSKGAVPTLQLDDGRILTEGAVIVQYLADQKPEAGLAPRAGTFERYQLAEILNYTASEVHKGFSPLFNPAISADAKSAALANLHKKFDWLTGRLGSQHYLLGDTFTVADAYLFSVFGHRSIEMARARRLRRARRSAPQSPGNAQGRRFAQITDRGRRT